MNATHVLLHRFRPGTGPQLGTPEHDEEMQRWDELATRLGPEVLVGGYALADRGVVLDAKGEHEWKAGDEVLFAVHAVVAADDAAAVEMARSMPTVEYGTVEVRPTMT